MIDDPLMDTPLRTLSETALHALQATSEIRSDKEAELVATDVLSQHWDLELADIAMVRSLYYTCGWVRAHFAGREHLVADHLHRQLVQVLLGTDPILAFVGENLLELALGTIDGQRAVGHRPAGVPTDAEFARLCYSLVERGVILGAVTGAERLTEHRLWIEAVTASAVEARARAAARSEEEQ